MRHQPTLIRAHYLLRTAYFALRNENKAVGEADQIETITQKNSDSDLLV
jgi:hypothetical protein